MGMIFAAALWGFAEATLFFVVPDMLLTFVALRWGWRSAVLSSLAAAAAASFGGLLMYRWGAVDAETARAIADHLPAISPGMIEDVRQSLSAQGAWAMFNGAFRGIPYKLYAIESGAAHHDAIAFLAISFCARLSRFVLLVTLVAAIASTFAHWLGARQLIAAHAVCWTLFYIGYWLAMPN